MVSRLGLKPNPSSPIAAPSLVLVTRAGDGISKAVVAELSARGFQVFAGLQTAKAVKLSCCAPTAR